MIIVNTTFIVHHSIDSEMKAWIKRSYIESATKYSAEGMRPLLTRVLSADDADTNTYAIHLYFPDLATARRWSEGVGQSLRAIISKRWGEKALSFHTYLEVTE